MIADILEYKRASRAFRKAPDALRFHIDEDGEAISSPEWTRLEKAWDAMVLNRPRLERFLSQPKVYQWIS